MLDENDVLICLGALDSASAAHGEVLPPVSQASLFRKASVRDLQQGLSREHEEFVYSRGTNPTVKVLEDRLAQLERGEACKCFASGMAAISAVLISLLRSSDHVLFVNSIYGPTLQLAELLGGLGIAHTAIHGDDVGSFEKFILPETKLIYFESPGSMTFGLAPIRKIAVAAKERGILTCIDNTVSTPLFQKPLEMGIDISVHSLTKYVGGHSDAVGGAAVSNRDLMKKIFYRGYMLFGGAMAPQNASLFLRGLMTMPDRIRKQQADSIEIARFLRSHPKVREVLHPALSEKDEELFRTQMGGYTGLFSVVLDVESFGDLCEIVDRLRLFGKAVSWGGVESLVIPALGFDDEYGPQGIPKNLIRLSVGLEGAGPLIEDLKQALH